jgi:DNA-binding CsgD family transcriptional regulator
LAAWRLNLPSAVLRANGTVLSTNALLKKMRKQFVSASGERLAIINRGSHELFQAAIVSSARKPRQLHCQSIPVSAVDDDPACVAHLLPVRRQAQDIFNGASILLLVTALGKPKAPSAHVLHGLFDLTAAEAKVACSLTDGSSVETIASASSLSRETIRNQLKSVLTKTGTKRPAELIGLLIGAKIGRGLSIRKTFCGLGSMGSQGGSSRNRRDRLAHVPAVHIRV